MLKKGFTLQELLISLAVIGVVSAVALPSLMSIQPDKSKTMYMKAYNTLTTQTGEIMDDSSLYWDDGYNSAGEAENVGLYSDARPSIAPYDNDNNCQFGNKFPAILSHRLNLNGAPTYTGAQPGGTSTTDFRTTDGVNWHFETKEVSVNVPGGLGYQTDLTINIKPTDNSGNNPCSYSTTCLKPNEFKFRIDNDGGIRPADALGMAYLQNPTDTRSGATDKNLAAQIVKDAKSATDIDKMSTALTKIVGKTTCPTTSTTTDTTTTNSESK